MTDKLTLYQSALGEIPDRYLLWPLYGAGLENMGVDGKPISVPLRDIKDNELLVRHDACGLCFSDVKVINQGQNHPRIFRDMKTEPVVLGHEVSMTVMKVGEKLRDRYKVGDKLIVEADIYIKGVSVAYGYSLQGGLSQYSIIDDRVLNTDSGDNLIHVKKETGYAESALVEPWACVVAAYRLTYRTGIKNGGTLWVIGAGGNAPYTISKGFDAESHPAKLYLTNVPSAFSSWLKERAKSTGTEVVEISNFDDVPKESVDDIVLLGSDPDLIEKASPYLGQFGMFAVMAAQPMTRKVSVDVGRIHYMRWGYIGSQEADIAQAYQSRPIRSALKPGGTAWFVGAGGPIGRMHVQRAIQLQDHPATIVASDVSDFRLKDLYDSFSEEAKAKGIEFICLNPTQKEAYEKEMARFFAAGFDDVIVLAPIAAVISDAASHLAPNGVMNVFAGVGKGTMAEIDLSNLYLKGERYIGHSGSNMEDMLITLRQTEAGELSPNRAVAAIGSIHAARNGMQAVKDQIYPGKVVIYLHIKELPLTTLAEFKDKFPTVYAKLKNGREWTNEAEAEFLRLMLV